MGSAGEWQILLLAHGLFAEPRKSLLFSFFPAAALRAIFHFKPVFCHFFRQLKAKPQQAQIF
jgi:hypothetical protein